MTVFRGFLTLTKRNFRVVIMYIAIFMGFGILAVANSSQDSSDSMFQAQKLTIGIVDHDKSELSKGLSEYLSHFHTVRSLPDDTATLQNELFNRNVYYIVTIPEGFKTSCLEEHKALSVSKVPGSSDGYYVDQQINTYLNQARVLSDSGYSDSETTAYILKNAKTSSHVDMLQSNTSDAIPSYGYMYQYLPYVLLSILCYVIGSVMIAFHQPDLKRRILCSCVPARSQNLQLALSYLVVGLSVWLLAALTPALFLYRKSLLHSANMPYYLLNSLMILLVGLALAFLIGTFITNDQTLTAIVNVLTLGLSFLCGVFVPLDILGKGVKSLAHFLPVYWYEISNNMLNHSTVLDSSQKLMLYRNCGIQGLFAVAVFLVALVVRRRKAV